MEPVITLSLLGFAVVVFVAVAGVSSKVNISLPFVLSALVGGAVVAELVLSGPLLGVVPGSASFGVLTQYGTGALVATAAVLIVSWWYVRAWLIEGRDEADRATQSVARQAESFAGAWFKTWRYLALGVLGIGALFFGEIVSFLGEFPLAVSNIGAIALGYLQLGGQIPYVGGVISTMFPSMSATQWIFATAFLFVLGVGVRNA